MNFIFPAFLAGIAALLLPWLLHRFNRETPPETPFPSTQFLESTRVPVSRKKRLRHIGLFSLRALFIIAACLLFAQPYCSTDANRAASARNVLVVIDRSASMQTDDHWSQAVAKTADLLSTSREGESSVSGNVNSVQLFDMASTLTAHTELGSDIGAANIALRNLSPSFETAQYGLMMQQLDAIASRLDNPVDVLFVTDAQQTNLPLQRRLLRTQHIDSFQLHKIDTAASNLAVRASARVDDGVNVQVSAQVLYSDSADSGSDSPSTTPVTLRVSADGRELETRQFNLTKNVAEPVVFNNVIMPSAGIDELSVEISGENDALPVDSEITVPIQSDVPIQVGIGSIDMRLPETGALFLRTALNTDGLARVITSSNNGAGLSDDAKHWAVFVPHTAGAEVEVPQAVADFVSAGGNVLLVLVLEDSEGTDTLTAAATGADYIGSIDSAHPLALGELNWQDTRVYTPVDFSVDESDRILMRAGSGKALLVERSIVTHSGSAADANASATGRLLVLADPLDGVASDLPLQSAFVDWVANTVRWFDASIAFPSQLNAGESLLLPAQAQVLSPSGKTLRALSDSANLNQLQLNEPGVHTVITSTAEHRLAVSVPWEESDLTSFAVADDKYWGGELNTATAESAVVENDNESNTNETFSALNSDNRQPWWPWLMPLLALVLLAESIWANRLLSIRRDGV